MVNNKSEYCPFWDIHFLFIKSSVALKSSISTLCYLIGGSWSHWALGLIWSNEIFFIACLYLQREIDFCVFSYSFETQVYYMYCVNVHTNIQQNWVWIYPSQINWQANWLLYLCSNSFNIYLIFVSTYQSHYWHGSYFSLSI